MQVAALGPRPGHVVAHHRRAAPDELRFDLGAVVLRRPDGADQGVVGDRRGREQWVACRRHRDDDLGAIDGVPASPLVEVVTPSA